MKFTAHGSGGEGGGLSNIFKDAIFKCPLSGGGSMGCCCWGGGGVNPIKRVLV